MKRAIITGGAGLIGTEICSALVEQGYDVASFDLEQGPDGQRHIHCDVGDETSVTGGFEELGWDSLDLLVNNAGVAGPFNGPISELSLEEWRRVTDSHLTGAFLMTRSAVSLMGEGASIINMASTRAFMSEPETEPMPPPKEGWWR